MTTRLREVVGFTVAGGALVGLSVFVTRTIPAKSGADALPPYLPPVSTGGASAAVASNGLPVAHPLLQHPTISKTTIAFDYAGEIWTVPREGGGAKRLVASQLRNFRPIFSPDGTQIAFTGILDGNPDVYLVPATGGEPKRLTYHPGTDTARGWTPDGKRVLFDSTRATARDLSQLYTVSTHGGLPEALPLPSGTSASFSPDGKRIAYIPFGQWQPAWRKYRGGQTTPIWMADLSDSRVTPIPRENSNDRSPMWIGDSVYFLSDRAGSFGLFAYDVGAKAVRELVKNADGFDIGSASAGAGAIVYDQMGEIHVFDVATAKEHVVPITITAELPQVRPHFEHVAPPQILHAAISPTGKRALFETHGEILAAPAGKGDVRNLTRTPAVADRDPSWSPDGKWVAWLSDEDGEYALFLRSPDGVDPLKKVSLGDPPSFFYSPRWSPDSKKILLSDKRLNLWLVDLDHPTPVKIDTDRFDGASFDPSWSGDSKYVAYVKQLPNHFHGIFVYGLTDQKSVPLTDGRSDAFAPRFDRGGKYLWFVASTDAGPANAGGMVSMSRPTTYSVYGVVLRKDDSSPVAPESDEEGDAGAPGGDEGAGGDKAGKAKSAAADKARDDAAVKIDFEAIDQRIVSLPIDRANYYDLEVGPKGVLFLLAGPVSFADEDYDEFEDKGPPLSVSRFDVKTRKSEPFIARVASRLEGGGGTFFVSADASKVLYTADDHWFIVGTDKAPKDGDGEVKLDGAEVWVNPRAEWRQMFHEVWRIERDFLYDPHAHGLDLAAAERLYGGYLDGIAGRDDLNTLLEAGIGNLVLGHVWAWGGSVPRQRHTSVGLLGADFRVEDGRYRVARILRGENWNPKLRAPLTEPGVNVKEGDFLLAVDGEPLTGDDDVYRLFLGKADKQTVITVGPKADGAGAHKVTVVPVGSESALRLRTWMEVNKKRVDELSQGKVGYVYVPDTQGEGLTSFDRYYYAEAGKGAVVIDERFNHGGNIADYIVEVLARKPIMGGTTREGEDITFPVQAVFGPKVMVINQNCGSGGDVLPWLFREASLGPIVGKRTWGGWVGIGGFPHLIDGGGVTAPRVRLYGTKGEWEVENVGVAPDDDVEEDPALVRQGHDPQLERAVEKALDALAKNPPKKLTHPPPPSFPNVLPKAAP